MSAIQALAPARSTHGVAPTPTPRESEDLDMISTVARPRTLLHKAVSALPPAPAAIKNAVRKALYKLQPALPYVTLAGTVACLVGAARAYPCTGYGTADQGFINANKTLWGNIHGWFANCETYTYQCGEYCSPSRCTTSGSTTSCTPGSCTPEYCTEVYTTRYARDYVNDMVGLVQACGFATTNSLPSAPTLRLAQALIEQKHWTKVLVNAFNLTDVTDPAIACLHGIS